MLPCLHNRFCISIRANPVNQPFIGDITFGVNSGIRTTNSPIYIIGNMVRIKHDTGIRI